MIEIMMENGKFPSLADEPEKVLEDLQKNGRSDIVWLAMEKDGTWFGYNLEPTIGVDGWEMGYEKDTKSLIVEIFPNCLPQPKSWRLTKTKFQYEWTRADLNA